MATATTMQLQDPVSAAAALSRAPQLCRGVASPRSMVRLGAKRLPLCHSLRSTTSHPQRRPRPGAICCEAQESTATGVPGVVNESTWTSLVSDSDVPVLVDFWAPWCGPCRMIAPIIDDIAKKYGGKVRCLKLNTDESPNIATEYGIRSIPTVMVFVKGVKRDTVIGAVPLQTLTSTLDKFIAWMGVHISSVELLRQSMLSRSWSCISKRSSLFPAKGYAQTSSIS